MKTLLVIVFLVVVLVFEDAVSKPLVGVKGGQRSGLLNERRSEPLDDDQARLENGRYGSNNHYYDVNREYQRGRLQQSTRNGNDRSYYDENRREHQYGTVRELSLNNQNRRKPYNYETDSENINKDFQDGHYNRNRNYYDENGNSYVRRNDQERNIQTENDDDFYLRHQNSRSSYGRSGIKH